MSCKPLSEVLRTEYREIARRWQLRPAETLPDAIPPVRKETEGQAGQGEFLRDKLREEDDLLATNCLGEKLSEEDKLARLYKIMKDVQPRICEPGGGDPAKPHLLAALCFSGGGIRSATFNLGVLQRLAWHGLLDQFDYLSTVSGGGFIGSWLMAWAHRGGGLTKVARILKCPPSPEPSQVEYLRNFSRYLSPRFGLLSADTWTLVAVYIRNLLLNWLVLIPLLLAALMLPRLAAATVDLFPVLEYRSAHVPATPGSFGTAPGNLINLAYGLGLFLVAAAFAFALRKEPQAITADCTPPKSSAVAPVAPTAQRGGECDPSWRFQSQFLFACLLPLVLGAFCLSIGWAWDENWTDNHYLWFISRLTVPMLLVALVCGMKRTGFWAQAIATLVGALFGGTVLWFSALLMDQIHEWAFHLFGGQCVAAADGWETAAYTCLAVPLVLASLGAGAMVRIGVLSRLSTSTDEVREWWSRFGGWVLIASLAWLALSGLVLFAPGLLLYAGSEWLAAWAALGGVSGLLTILLGKSSMTPATTEAARSNSLPARATQVVLAVAAPIFVCLAITSFSLATDGLLLVRFPIAGWLPSGLSDWAGQHLVGLPPDAKGVQWHFAMVEVLNDTTESDLQDFLKRLKPTDSSDRRDLGNLTTWRQWGWHAGVNGRGLREDVERRLNQAVTSQWEGAVLLGLWFIALASFGGGASLLINLNRFSLLGTYRNRLIRAYLGASRSPAQRDPDAFTGFDEEDNLPMAELKQPADLGQTTTGTLPIHIINMTLNLAGEVDNLSWQDRKAESFIVSPFYCGSEELGYRETTEYGGTKGITAGTAVAISGAAVSPNMGASSSPAMAFLLTLFNVRLGSWLGNPGRAGDKTYPNSAPWNGAWHVVLEALGLTDERHPYIYLSDGGHFENLGLYEMVRRRCRFIVVCDAGADPDYGFEDLANAVRMIRIDFGIQITFYPSIDISRSTDRDVSKGKYCAIGHIRYTSDKTDDGFLLYIKPAFYQRNEPVDVRGYAGQSKKFPNETTADQFFTESQFESYRALGEHIVDEIQGFKPGDAPMTPTETFESFRRCVKDSLLSELRQKQSRPSGASSGGGGSKSGGSQGEKGDRGDHGERGPK